MMTLSDIQRIEAALDHTLLKPDVSEAALTHFCSDAEGSAVAAICIPPTRVVLARCLLQGSIPVCTVIGFPNGTQTTATKVAEATEAVLNGAAEIDVVINLGFVRDKNFAALHDEVTQIRQACAGSVLKIILETGALSTEECVACVQTLNDTGIDFYKTSTGFNFPGASLEMVRVIADFKRSDIQIKASGGIRDLDTALAYLDAGATRIGSSGLLATCREAKGKITHG